MSSNTKAVIRNKKDIFGKDYFWKKITQLIKLLIIPRLIILIELRCLFESIWALNGSDSSLSSNISPRFGYKEMGWGYDRGQGANLYQVS